MYCTYLEYSTQLTFNARNSTYPFRGQLFDSLRTRGEYVANTYTLACFMCSNTPPPENANLQKRLHELSTLLLVHRDINVKYNI